MPWNSLRRSAVRCLAVLLSLLAGSAVFAAPAALSDLPELKPLKYRLLGPAWGGRVSRVAGVPGNPLVYYAATAGGGVWKSTDGGIQWASVWEEQPISSIGSIAVAVSDPNVVYVGSGEANIRGNVAAGNGIYKSTDAGKTWAHVWKQEGQIGTMIVHPQNPDVAFAAVLGHAFGPNPERGVYRTEDGGKSWKQVLKKDADTGASDVAFDPQNPRVVFAGLWQARRRPWEMTSGGPGSGLWVSRDGGDSWKQLKEKGLPEGIWGKVGVAVAPSDARRVYALIEANEGGLFRSDDGGESWTRINGDRRLRQRAWYYSTLTVSPGNPDEVWAPQVPMLKSIDGGKSFAFIKVDHGDCHDLWIDPANPKRMIGADDGGVFVSHNGGESWYTPALPIGQFYHVSADNRVPFHVAGAMQDIGTAQGPSDSLSSGGIRNTDWYDVGGGEAGWVVSDPSEPDIVYAGEYAGIITRYDHRTRQARNVTIYPENPSGHGGEDMRYRFQWTAPITVSPHDPKVIYHGGNVVFRTRDGGQTWAAISPDLTRNDKSKQKGSGGPITGDNTGVETYCTVFVIAESPVKKGLIWAGTDDGLVQVTTDGGASWKNVTAAVPGLPEWGTVSMIEPSRWDAETAYLVVDAHRLDDMRPYLWKTTDLGKTWKRLSGDLPADVYLHAVREDPVQKGLLYLGTERGLAFSKDGGATWQALKLNLPTVAVHDVAIKDNTLVAATMGRSLWAFDDLAVLRTLSPEVTAGTIHLFPAPDAVRFSYHDGPGDRFKGDNPPHGASIYYWLKEELKEKEEVTLEVLDGAGMVVARLSSTPRKPIRSSEYVDDETESLSGYILPKEAGIQRAVWDLTLDGAAAIEGAVLDAGYPAIGPRALPGTYTLRLKAPGGKVVETPLKVVPDPRSQVTAAEFAEQEAFGLEVRGQITRLTRTVERLHAVKKQLADRNALLAGADRANDLVVGSKELIAKLDALEGKLHNPKAEVLYDILATGARLYSRMSPLLDTVGDVDGPPTQGVREVFADQKKELDGYVAELEGLVANDLAALNRKAKELDLPAVWVPPAVPAS